MPHRYFTKELANGQAALTGSDAHHLANVMRARIGEEVVLCGPDGLEYTGTVTAITPGRVEFSVNEGAPSKAEPSVATTLFVGYPKQGKLDEIIRHSVELGVTEIVPFFSRYCVAAPKNEEKKNVRYQRVALEAAKQSGRGMIPEVSGVVSFKEALEQTKDFEIKLIPYENARGMARTRELLDSVRPGDRVAVFIGPEGGFEEEEVAMVVEAGAEPVTLGKRILRTETAGLAMLAALGFWMEE